MTALSLSLGVTWSDRTAPLAAGLVKPRGIELNCITGHADEIFFRGINHREFDVCEMSFAAYVMKRARGEDDLLAIPVFLSRSFRHASVYVRENSLLRSFNELTGARVGTPEYPMTSNVWLRDMLMHEHGVSAEEMTWFFGGLDQPNRSQRIGFQPPENVKTTRIEQQQTLSAMLLDGDLDAIISPDSPVAFEQGWGVRRLLDDPKAAEAAYYAKTGVFPIMHLVVIKREVHQRFPWVAREMYLAFEQALAFSVRMLRQAGHPAVSMAWILESEREQRAVLGGDAWAYGLAPNMSTVGTFLAACLSQGLVSVELDPADLFLTSALNEGDYAMS